MRARLLTFLLPVALAAALPGGAQAAAVPAWQAAETVRTELVGAQTALILDDRAAARASVRRADAAYAGELRAKLRSVAPTADRTVQDALADAARAAAADEPAALARARGEARGAVMRGAFYVTVEAAAAGDAATARDWLKLREFRTATRYTRAGADATLAVGELAAGTLGAAATRDAVRKDLLDAYQARTRELLDDVARTADRGLASPAAEAAALADGYWAILRARYVEDRGPAAADAAGRAFDAVARTADATTARAAKAALEGFTAAPFTPEESARRAQQLLQFLALVPVEYGRGVKGTRVTADFEIQEGAAFAKASTAALADLQDQLAKLDKARTDRAVSSLATLVGLVDQATRRTTGVPETGQVDAATKQVEDLLKATMPEQWQEATSESDYDLIALTLDRMEAAVGSGQYQQAEQARLEAYAFFEFGPERRLNSFNQSLALTVEGLIWFGDGDTPGLAELIAKRASRREVRETRIVLDKELGNAAATLGDSANKTTVVTNAAIIVFREGLEAVLILAAITASFVGAKRRMRRPVLIGAALGLVVSLLTWVLAQTVLDELSQYGEKLEAVVGLIAIAVLLLITNWFFHKVYWSEWIGKFHRQRRKLTAQESAGFFSAQVLGLATLGLTSVYREGFETVLFLQSLQLSAGTAAVVEGAGLGLALTLSVAVVTFALQRKLPYKKMLIVTGVMIGFVLVVMVGQTARTMQGTGWLPITPLDVDVPYWGGQWLGIYPTWETIGAQIAAAAFVIGSYYLAQEVRVKRPQRKRKKGAKGGTTETAEPTAPVPATAMATADGAPAASGLEGGQDAGGGAGGVEPAGDDVVEQPGERRVLR